MAPCLPFRLKFSMRSGSINIHVHSTGPERKQYRIDWAPVQLQNPVLITYWTVYIVKAAMPMDQVQSLCLICTHIVYHVSLLDFVYCTGWTNVLLDVDSCVRLRTLTGESPTNLESYTSGRTSVAPVFYVLCNVSGKGFHQLINLEKSHRSILL